MWTHEYSVQHQLKTKTNSCYVVSFVLKADVQYAAAMTPTSMQPKILRWRDDIVLCQFFHLII